MKFHSIDIRCILGFTNGLIFVGVAWWCSGVVVTKWAGGVMWSVCYYVGRFGRGKGIRCGVAIARV